MSNEYKTHRELEEENERLRREIYELETLVARLRKLLIDQTPAL